MSHFVVIVIGNDYEKQLEKYDEGIVVAEYEDEELSDSEKEDFIEFYSKGKIDKFDELYKKHSSKWNDDRYRKNKDGVWMKYSTYNPDAKWDWYSVGGRWTGYFRLKPNKEGVTGNAGIFTEPAKDNEADQVKKGDVDFNGMLSDNIERLTDMWTKAQKYLEMGDPKTYDEIRESVDTDDKARELYKDQPAISGFMKDESFGYFTSLFTYKVSLDDYIENNKYSHLVPYAYVKDGEWFAKGEMDWWGISNDNEYEELKRYKDEFISLMESLPDDTILTAIDCHI